MSETLTLVGQRREAGHARAVRRAGKVPGVVYGHGEEAVAIQVEEKLLRGLLAHGGDHHLIRLTVEGTTLEDQPVVVRELQADRLLGKLLHVDFQAVNRDERVHTHVPLRILGEREATHAGGVLQVQLHTLEVECAAENIPDAIDVDISHLTTGGALHVADVTPPGTCKLIGDPDAVILTILAPRTGAGQDDEEDKADGEA